MDRGPHAGACQGTAALSDPIAPATVAVASAEPVDARLARAYVDACRDELAAPKPGNVSTSSPGHDMTADDFLRSAEVSAPCLCRPGLPLGERVLAAVAATRTAVGCNTNLGIVLLCAPLLMAAQHGAAGESLDARVEKVLQGLDLNDTAAVFQAIRLASPAGLGQVEAHDVNDAPRLGLRQVMQSAAHRDHIALQYASGFQDVLGLGANLLDEAAKRFEDRTWQTVALYLGLLARIPDTHVARKFGRHAALDVQRQARTAQQALERRGAVPEVAGLLREFDTQLKRGGINPGTTADLTVATLLAQRLEAGAASAVVRTAGHEG